MIIKLDALAGLYSEDEILDVDAMLDRLADEDPEGSELVRLHVFGGLSITEAGFVLGMSRTTAYRNWDYARAWLRNALEKSEKIRDDSSLDSA